MNEFCPANGFVIKGYFYDNSDLIIYNNLKWYIKKGTTSISIGKYEPRFYYEWFKMNRARKLTKLEKYLYFGTKI